MGISTSELMRWCVSEVALSMSIVLYHIVHGGANQNCRRYKFVEFNLIPN
jgi:hypothetical protein